MKKVAVLLSAYNGEKYIEEQIESILEQSGVEVELYARDDGSSDGTCTILEKYERDGKLHLEKGKNVGFVQSFMWLVANCENADYYAFADQDDVWLKNKLLYAVEEMEKKDDSKPLLYFSNYDFYDQDMKFMEHCGILNGEPSFRNSLVDCITLGFNSVFNNVTRDMMKENIPQKACGHDWWSYMLCAGLGEVIYDRRVTVKYRRTGTNVSPGGASFLKHQIWRIKHFFGKKYFEKVQEQMTEFEHLYGEQLSSEDRKVLGLFTERKHRIRNGIKKVCYPKRFRLKMIDEILIRMVFLIGKL